MLKLSRDLACLILRQDSEAASAVSPSLDEEAEVGRMTRVGLEQDMPYGEIRAVPAETCCFPVRLGREFSIQRFLTPGHLATGNIFGIEGSHRERL